MCPFVCGSVCISAQYVRCGGARASRTEICIQPCKMPPKTALPAFVFLAVAVAAHVLPSAALVVFTALAGLALLRHLHAEHDRALQHTTTVAASPVVLTASAPELVSVAQEPSSRAARDIATLPELCKTPSAATSSSTATEAADPPSRSPSATTGAAKPSSPSSDYPNLTAEERAVVQRLIDTLNADASFQPDHVSM